MKKIVSPGLRVERCLLASDPPVDRNLLHPWAKQQKSPRPWPWKIKVGCSKHRGLGYAKLPFPRENADQTVILECLILRQAWELWLPQLCAVTFSPAPAKRFRNQKLAQRHWKLVFVSFLLFLHISTSKSINWIPGLVSRLHAYGTMPPQKIAAW